MKKILLYLSIALCNMGQLYAQLPTGSVAPDFTLTDLNGNTHHLYDYLDAGKGIILDFSATWCPACWQIHNANILQNTYNLYGPSGTDELMVFFVEGDVGTTVADLQGSGSSQGDWVTGTPFPIMNPSGTSGAAMINSYQLPYFPTLYKVCPNRTIEQLPSSLSLTPQYIRNKVLACPSVANGNDPALLSYSGADNFCSQVELIVTLQNNGNTPLTQASITATAGGNTIATTNWTGNLNTYQTADVSLGNVTLSAAANVQFTVSSGAGNAIGTNDQISRNLVPAVVTNGSIVVSMQSDNWTLNDNTNFFIEDGNGNVVAGTATGSLPEMQVLTYTFNVPPSADCYRFVIRDSYGDGMTYNGAYLNVADSNGASIFTNNDFGFEGGAYFNVPLQTPTVRLKAYLEGVFSTATQQMLPTNANLLPLQQPYHTAPWNYTGTESVSSIPANAVDWVLVEARQTTNPATIVDQAAAWLLADGTIVDYQNTTQGVRFEALTNGSNYLFTLRHRNHLAVLSRQPITVSSLAHTTLDYDFTTAASQAVGGEQLKQVAPNQFALMAGDINANGIINAFHDFNATLPNLLGYRAADLNLNGTPDSNDIDLWRANVSKIGIPTLRY